MNKYIKSAMLLATVGTLVPGFAAAKLLEQPAPVAAQTMTSTSLCDAIKSDPDFVARAHEEVESSPLDGHDALLIVDRICQLHAASPAERQQMWMATLTAAVNAGMLTQADKTKLSALPSDASVLATWAPTTQFGQYLQDGAQTQSSPDTSGSGWLIGAIVGGVIGGALGGPAGFEAGVAIGGAAGDLAEEYSNLGDDTAGGGSGGEGGSEG
jgi:hypothetical protein